METLCPFCGTDVTAEAGQCPDCGQPRLSAYGDGSGETVEYDLSEWNAGDRAMLAMSLSANNVPYRWEPNLTLAVAGDLENQTDALVERVREDLQSGELEEASDDWGEGEAAFEAFSELFDAADRLHRQPASTDAADELRRALTVVEGASPPYGFNPVLWQTANELAQQVRELLDAGAGEDDVAAAAEALRDVLRDHV